MSTVREMIRRLDDLNLDEVVHESLGETADDLLEANKEQMYAGSTNEDQPISPAYKDPYYARKKNQMNAAPGLGVPDLKLTGAFYDGTQAEVNEDAITLTSNVEYAKYLEARYGADKIWGLTRENLETYTFGPFMGILKEKIEGQTGLTFKP